MKIIFRKQRAREGSDSASSAGGGMRRSLTLPAIVARNERHAQ